MLVTGCRLEHTFASVRNSLYPAVGGMSLCGCCRHEGYRSARGMLEACRGAHHEGRDEDKLENEGERERTGGPLHLP